MICKIAKKEFLLNLMTFKFAVATIVCVVLTAVFTALLIPDYHQRLKDYNENVAANEAELRKVMVYKNITPTVYRPPAVLSFFSEGLEKRLGNSARIEWESISEISATSAEVNPFLSIFPALDVTLIFKIVMSILALLVVYDVVSGEREQGTLKLMLSGTVARYQVLVGKLLAGLVTLVVSITASFIIGVLILLSFPMVDLALSDWARIALMYIASLIFISAMYNVGLFFSCLTKKSAISLMIGLFVWIIFLAVIPNASVRLATEIQPVEPREKMYSQIISLQEELYIKDRKGLWRRFQELRKRPDPRNVVSGGRGAFGRGYIKVVSKTYFDERRKRNNLPGKMRYADKIWEIQHSYLKSLFNQKYLANTLSRISPICLYENIMSALAETDAASFQNFAESTQNYRNRVIEYIGSKTDNFSAPSLFTQITEEEMVECGELYVQNREAWKQWRRNKIAKQQPLDLQDLAPFVYKGNMVRSLRRAIPDLGLLLFVSFLFFALSFVAFMRYDVRSD